MIRSLPSSLSVSAGIYLVVSLLCTGIPLVNYLGFEFSFVMASLGSVLSGITAINLFRRPAAASEGASQNPGRLLWRVLAANGSLLLIPLIVLSANALFVRNCSFFEGVLFFLLLPVVSVWFSTCLAFFVSAHYDHPRIVFLAVLMCTLLYAGGIGYLTPAIYSYNLFYGFFPGLTYDEILTMNEPLVLFRAATVLLGSLIAWAGLLIITDGPAGRSTIRKGTDLARSLVRPGRRLLSASAVLFFASLFVLRNELGFETHAGYIRSSLGSSISTEHLTIYYSDSSFSPSEALWLAAEHEFRLHQIEEFLGLSLEGRLESYIYPSTGEKARFIGAGRTSIAKPWSGEMHLDAGSVREVLKHEMVHLVAAPLGIPAIRTSVYPGLTEGLAMAVEWDWGSQTLHEHSAAMLRHGVRPDIEVIMGSLGFIRQSSSVSYVLAGSFCRFLADRYSAGLVAQVYARGNFEEVYGKPLSVLVAEWHEMLDGIVTDHSSFDRVDLFFRSPAIFDRICPRAIANTLVEAGKRYQGTEFIAASRLYRSAYEEGRGAAALNGYLRSELRLGNTGPALSLPDSIRSQGAPGHLLPLLLTTGDAFWLEGRLREAEEAYERVACAELSRLHTETALVRLLALEEGDSGERLRTLFLSGLTDSARISFLDSVLAGSPEGRAGFYLRGLSNLRLGRYEEAVSDLEGVATGDRLDRFRFLSLGDAYFRMRRFGDARASYLRALGIEPGDGLLAAVTERVERCDWFAAMKMPDALAGGAR